MHSPEGTENRQSPRVIYYTLSFGFFNRTADLVIERFFVECVQRNQTRIDRRN